MTYEKSAGAIVFKKEGNIIKYLVLSYPSVTEGGKIYWGFPKGLVEKEEPLLETARREVKEESGLSKIKFIEGFKEREHYLYKYKGELIVKDVFYFLAEVEKGRVKISKEHVGYAWLPSNKALERLSFKGAKEILKKANQFLQKGKNSA